MFAASSGRSHPHSHGFAKWATVAEDADEQGQPQSHAARQQVPGGLQKLLHRGARPRMRYAMCVSQ